MPTFKHGSLLYLSIGGNDISGITTDVKVSRTVDKSDTTTGGATSKTSIPGLKDSSLTATCKYDATLFAALVGLIGTAAQTAIYGPAGNATPKMTCTGYVSKVEPNSKVTDANDFSLEFQPVGGWTDS